MGEAEVGTPKYLANKMKAEGLQKLCWYCQMCQTQCRDENGFKCHTTSESHQRLKRERQELYALDKIMTSEEYKHAKANRKDYWLSEGIEVKLKTRAYGHRNHKQNGVVVEVIEKYCAKIKLLATGEKVSIYQGDVETVIPAVGKLVRVLNGGYRGSKAKLINLEQDNFCASIEIAAGPFKGRIVNNVQYEDISKLFLQ